MVMTEQNDIFRDLEQNDFSHNFVHRCPREIRKTHVNLRENEWTSSRHLIGKRTNMVHRRKYLIRGQRERVIL